MIWWPSPPISANALSPDTRHVGDRDATRPPRGSASRLLTEYRALAATPGAHESLRFNEMPTVEVHIVDSEETPTGIGEPGVPPIAPAVENAWVQLTGKPTRRLPFTRAARENT